MTGTIRRVGIRVLLDIVPANPFKALTEGKILQVIFFAGLVGFALVKLGERTARLRALAERIAALPGVADTIDLDEARSQIATITSTGHHTPRWAITLAWSVTGAGRSASEIRRLRAGSGAAPATQSGGGPNSATKGA